MTRLSLFDFDGTLADSFPFFAETLGDVADRFGFRRFGADEVDDLRALGAREIMARAGVPMWKVPAIAAHFRARMAERINEIPLFPGAGEMLAGVRAGGATIAVVTSNAEDNVRRVLGPELARLVDHFDCGLALFGKAARIRRLIRHFGRRPDDCVFVGDELRDLDAARACGIRFVGVGWGYTRPDALAAAGADVVVNVGELASVLRAAASPAPRETPGDVARRFRT